MASINKSFLYGIGFASITWIISLYLYSQLTRNDNASKSLSQQPWNVNSLKDARNEQYFKSKKNSAYFDKSFFDKGQGNNYVNSDKLIKKLQPVVVKVNNSNTIDPELIDLGMVRTVEEGKIKDEGYKTHAFNVLISNKLSYHRTIPDTRNELCKNVSYPALLPPASVIVCFYNEHYHTLLRTVHSILDRTPDKLLEEIILVDDYSDLSGLHENVEKYIKTNELSKVKLFKTDKREGLIRARMFGADKAKGKVIIFLDSHIEVNVGWVQPLLARIKQNRTNVVMPLIDIINADTFAYSSSPLVRGGFNWGLHFKWENLPKGTLANNSDFIRPIKSPTMAGGLFAIDRKYFIDIGEYDSGMNIWGGENLEISFRVWMCGGNLELIPCSRVGHVFRHRRPYGAPDGQDTMLYNSLRVAHVWMDEYKEFFLSQRKDAKTADFGDITSRVQLRKELKCKGFDWYVKNVYPELTLPSDDKRLLQKKWSALERDKYQPWHSRKRNYVNRFQLRLSDTGLCAQSAREAKTKGAALVLRQCVRGGAQLWYETDKNELVLSQLFCLQASKKGPTLFKCHEMGADQEWQHKGSEKSPIYNIGAGMCLGAKEATINSTVIMRLCTDPELNMWDLVR